MVILCQKPDDQQVNISKHKEKKPNVLLAFWFLGAEKREFNLCSPSILEQKKMCRYQIVIRCSGAR